MRKKSRWLPVLALGGLAPVAAPVFADDWVEIVQVRPPSGVIYGVTDGEVSNRRREYLEITVKYNLESDCAFSVGAGQVTGYWGIDTNDPIPFDILPGPDTSEIPVLLDRTGRGTLKFRWSFECHPDAPAVIDGYVWNLGASLRCSTGELDYVEPILGLDYWVIDCP